ncbi:hypothetical protein [Thermosipho atlanticus]|uniref:Cell shape protein MreC n=1 Tax=Thermosipho atlanticus DSM 15807 TaxID=1123380 RepID=A0A1M5QPH8_9BACT|nr:hypothetical protein [Thermosipho atlanticus]SHH15846.1 hypothetical protein SAMN02745199_0061 [Thermosipho atlanticus DSM 15807]
MKNYKNEVLLFVLLILISIFLVNVLLENRIVKVAKESYSRIFNPFFLLRKVLNELMERKEVTYEVNLFDSKLDVLEVLSYSIDGIYFYEIKKPGIVLTVDGKFVGIAKTTGKYVYVKKWWYDTINVTIITGSFELEAIIKDGKLIIEDEVDVKSGEVYLSKYSPYGYLLYKQGISLGNIKDGIFFKNLPNISFKTKFILLPDYIKGRG